MIRPPAPRVTVVIVTWNRRDCILNLLDSLQSIAYPGLNILVVDNASNDGSADAIRKHPLPLMLLENSENLGGTGGFNTGLRYALERLQQDYLWLLDNDAEVTADTLRFLVEALESEPGIAAAGSCILSPEDHALIVEAGGFVDRVNGTWTPNRRYQRYEPLAGTQAVEDVDYVPACSALFRAGVVRQVGVLDDRYFLHWDDIDFCARVRGAGHRVVAVYASAVYHGAEKGHSPVTLYYDFRNALLYFGKHARGAVRFRAYVNILSNFLTSMVYLAVVGRKVNATCLLHGLRDFVSGRFGRSPVQPGSLGQAVTPESGTVSVPVASRRVLLFAVGSFEEVVAALRSISAAAPRASITVAVAAERAGAYRLPEVSALISFDLLKDGVWGKLQVAAAVLAGRFDCGVFAGASFTVPYAFLLRSNVVHDASTGRFGASDVSRSGLWKVLLAVVLGKLLLAACLIPVLFAGKSYAQGRPSGTFPARAAKELQ